MRHTLGVAALLAAAHPARAATCTVDLALGPAEACGHHAVGTASATSRGDVWCGVGGETGGELVVQLTPPAGRAVRVLAGPAVTLPGDVPPAADLDLFVGPGDCPGACSTSAASPTSSVSEASFVSDGAPWFLVLDADQGLGGWSWGLEITCGDLCDPARVDGALTCTTPVAGTTVGRVDTLSWYACGAPTPGLVQQGAEAVHAFVPEVSGPVTLRLTDLSSDHDLYVLEDACDAIACVAGADTVSSTTESVTFDAVAGRTVYVVVEGRGGPGTWKLTADVGSGGCPEDCDDHVDDDGDGAVDCDDADCAAEASCASCDRDRDGFVAASCGGGDCDDGVVHTGDADRDGFPNACDVCGLGSDALDADHDGVPDACDACPRFDDAADGDGDGVADGCDLCPGGDDALDADSDAVPDGCDLCPGSDDALDRDADAVPDGCDLCPGGDDALDGDGDGIPNACDTCVGSADRDGDGVPDACDACEGAPDGDDADQDGIPDGCDACPAGPDHADLDRDGVADACDACPGADDARDLDGDGVPDACDACPQADDRLDADGDGVADPCDACPGADDAADGDLDGVADGCDACPGSDDGTDRDADSVPDGCDACRGFDDRLDADLDLVPDGCDACAAGDDHVDRDGDGTADACDPCPTVALAVDLDGDGDPGCAECDDHDPVRNLRDADHDGFTSCGLDCNDHDPSVRPGAIESVNGADDDCDGRVDDGTTWYDDDGDGFAELGGDCDDADPTIRPGAPEACDGRDHDCDTVPGDGTTCADDDGDGFCEAACVDGSLPGDCDDRFTWIEPGATEVVGNGVDDDCDGVIDANVPDLDGDGFAEAGGDCDDHDATLHPGAPELPDGVDQDCDGAVDEGTELADDDGDGLAEVDGDCDDSDPGTHPGAAEVANGVDDDCDGTTDEATTVADDDGDGLAEVAGDCDDADADVRPGAPERANGRDDDCDGATDEGLDDVDGDGFSATAGDCDDGDGWVYPGAHEICDGVDEDCDGVVDDGCAGEAHPTPEPPDATGCGCASGGALPLPGLLALAATTLLRRRRQALAVGLGALAGCGSDPFVSAMVPEVDLAPGHLDLGGVPVGEAVPSDVVLSLARGTDLVVTDVTLTPLLGEGFTFDGAPVFEVHGEDLHPLPLTFVGRDPGYVEAELTVTSDARGSPHVVSLRARALEPALDLDPPVLDLGLVAVNARVEGEVTLLPDAVAFALTDVVSAATELEFGLALPLRLTPGTPVVLPVAFRASSSAAFEATVRFGVGGRELPTVLVVRANDCARGVPAAYDVDGDGVSVCAGDCDDGDPARSPRVPETVDGLDQDCDGVADDGTAAADDDGDGWCEGPYACSGGARPGDCRDDDASAHPYGDEIPSNGVDDDCDGVIDDGVVDRDHDGFSPSGGDCDDADPSIHPGAVERFDRVDQDCDGVVDENTEVYDDDHDGWCESRGACAGGALPGDCDDRAADVHPGAPELRNHLDDDCDTLVDEGTTWADDDGDGFTEQGGDCDDANPAKTPLRGC